MAQWDTTKAVKDDVAVVKKALRSILASPRLLF
jgi:hypothetical protein